MNSVLIIGCGKIGGIYDSKNNGNFYSHSSAYFDSDLTDKIIFCDINIENAKKIAKIYDSEFYGSEYDTLIKKFRPDVISICTPTESHFQIASSILKQKFLPKVIFIEKPVCQSSNELNKLIELSNLTDVKLIANHTRRFDSKHQKIKQLIKSNFFGDLVRIDCFFYGGWKHNGIHLVDTINYLFDDILVIKSSSNKGLIKENKDFDVDVKLKFNNSMGEIFFNSFDEDNYQIFEMDIKFSRSRLRIEDFGNRFVFETKYVNEMKENVIMLNDINLNDNTPPLCNAISLIYKFLETSDISIIEDYSIREIGNSMNCIWSLKQ
tara:strand:- start:14760 stop:15725 length:966 start_codon:yes stop_codon:yes gene_type:complete